MIESDSITGKYNLSFRDLKVELSYLNPMSLKSKSPTTFGWSTLPEF
jgi:hypothetical protein